MMTILRVVALFVTIMLVALVVGLIAPTGIVAWLAQVVFVFSPIGLFAAVSLIDDGRGR